jgi:hypothetical protein
MPKHYGKTKKSLPDRVGISRTGGRVSDAIHGAAAKKEERRVARSKSVRSAAKTGDKEAVKKAVAAKPKAYASTTYSAPGRAMRESGPNSSRSAAQRVRKLMG